MSALRENLVAQAKKIGEKVVAAHAADVDATARFPTESFAALKEAKLLSAMVPKALGGPGATVSDIAAVCTTLGHYCASTAMVYAMHQSQVACITRHCGSSAWQKNFIAEMCKQELLIASATSEAGIGGDVRTSSCAVETTGDRFTLAKNATVISYGAHADAVCLTARRTPDSPPSDQVLVVCPKGTYTLEQTSGWDTLGMRGTCSNGYWLRAKGSTEQVLPTPYADISAQTMLPSAHVFWASLWLGIASDALNRSRLFIRGEARKKPGSVPPGAVRLAEASNQLQLMRANVTDCAAAYEAAMATPEATTALGFAIRMNHLKTGTSQMAIDVVNRAMLINGIHGYRNDSPFSVARHLRDVHSAQVMVSNDRIFGTTASLLLVHKED
ncbi:MAG: acyl-CoA/acyl-ACP dehydrogenase [Myxococcaceae bacterium]|nr:acyl-CoA/acyl-ACP dehydrogenase [Myxococcaceae bacterium]